MRRFGLLWRVLSRALRRATRADDGFGVTEFIVAFGVVFTMLAGLAYTVASGFQDIGFSRQRQAANGMATQLIEQSRGVAFAEIQKGIDTANLSTSDPNLKTGCAGDPAGTWRFKACTGTAPTGEVIVHSTRPDPANPNDPNDPNARVAPFDPHNVTGVNVEQTTLNRAVYVTKATNPDDAYRVIVRVTWDRSLRPGPQALVETHTLLFSPDGCRSTVTHPFAAPCQPFLYGTADAPAGSVKLTGTVLTGTQQTQLPDSSVDGPSARADVQDEQVARIVGKSTAAALRAGADTGGGESVATTADGDVATSSPTGYQSLASTPGAASTISNSGLTLSQQTNGDSLDSVSAATATTPNTCPTPPSPPTAETDSEPCGRARATQGGAVVANLSLSPGGTALGNAVLARIDSTGSQRSGFVDRDPIPSQAGNIAATASRTLGEVTIGGLPDGVDQPPGWEGYFIRLTGYSDSATASAGAGTTTPTASISGGTVRYWTGSGYATQSVSSATSVVPFTQLTWSPPQTVGGLPIQITISGADVNGVADPNAIQSGGAAVDDPAPASTRELAKATVAPPLVGKLHYVVTVGGVATAGVPRIACGEVATGGCVADLEISIDLGMLVANATYEPAPAEST